MTPFAKYTHYVSVMVQRLAYLAFTREYRGGRGSTPRNGIIFSRHCSFFLAHPPIIVAVRGSFIPHSHSMKYKVSFRSVTADNETEKRRYVRFIGQKVQVTSKSNYHTSRVTHCGKESSQDLGLDTTAKVLFPHLIARARQQDKTLLHPWLRTRTSS